MLFINVEMSTMAAENFEAGRLGQLGIEVNRLVERCIKGLTIFRLMLLKYSVIS
jgi:exosome complex RNA-binding protein Rrp42 (RNase PH superfamily)